MERCDFLSGHSCASWAIVNGRWSGKSQRPHGLVAADVADLHAQRFLVAADGAVPKLIRFLAVEADTPQMIALDFHVAVPWLVFLGGLTVETDPLYGLQPLIADSYRHELLLLTFGFML